MWEGCPILRVCQYHIMGGVRPSGHLEGIVCEVGRFGDHPGSHKTPLRVAASQFP
jgi:hypothetical protein